MVHEDAEKRLSIIKSHERHGLAATLEAFEISRRTLYSWRAMNAHVERFNRTIQEEFVDYDLLQDDLLAFNDKLFDYLPWYNTQRPHLALALETPMHAIAAHLNNRQCNRYWPNTVV